MTSLFGVATFVVACLLTLPPTSGSGVPPGALVFNVSEQQPVGTEVGSVRRPSDSTSSRLRYSFRPSPNRYLHIDPRSGLIRTAVVLDRETICPFDPVCELVADVIVTPHELYQLHKVVVRVHDINDQTPAFPADFILLNVSESAQPGTRFSLPAAEDYDSDQFAVTGYLLEPSSLADLFNLSVVTELDGSQQVSLVLRQRLDRESRRSYDMSIVAVDGGTPQRSDSLRVRLAVIDENDNPPQFTAAPGAAAPSTSEQTEYEATIVENAPVGTTVLRVYAEDPDEGPNGKVSYRFTDTTERSYGSVLSIDAITGTISTLGAIDYERDPVIRLTVAASDSGLNPLTSLAHVILRVEDVNDNAPTVVIDVPDTSGLGHVIEGAVGGSFVARVAARDADGGPGGRVTCVVDSREGIDRLFRLSQVGVGEYRLVTVTGSESLFDREMVPRYRVLVTCRDHGPTPASANAYVDVIVDDVNDNSPQMSKDRYEFFVPENNVRSTRIGQLAAVDADSGQNANIEYRIEPRDVVGEAKTPPDAISIDSTFGYLMANIVFDFERQRKYCYRVIVTDAGQPRRSSTAELDIIVVDVDDERPVFDQSVYHFRVVENSPAGTGVGQVRAVDSDLSPEFKLFTYRIEPSDSGVDVDTSTGLLRTVRVLDREETSQLRVRVLAVVDPYRRDDNSSFCDVIVDLVDENDNAPVIVSPSVANGTIYVQIDADSQPVAPGSRIVKIDAVDPDEGPDANLTYFIVADAGDNDLGQGHVQFNIDPVSGWIAISSQSGPQHSADVDGRRRAAESARLVESGQLDRSSDYDGRTVELTIGVTDNGEPPRTTYGRLVVQVPPLQLSRSPIGVVQSTSEMTWLQRLIVVVCSAVGAAILAAIIFCILLRQCNVKWRRQYNCRLREANHISSDFPRPVGSGSLTSLSRSKDRHKKGVTFNLDADVDEFSDDANISSPLRDNNRFCTLSDCALHHLPTTVTTSYPCQINTHTPGCQPQHPVLLPGCDLERMSSSPQLDTPRYCRLPCRVATLQVPNGSASGHHLSPKSTILGLQSTYSGPCTTSPSSYSVGRCSTFSFSRSEGSLTDSGQGHSDPDDIVPSPNARVRFPYTLPSSESEV